jgi:2-polyprenyl-3-methyl-5-hydroxy-6-metoxy-1,4-benzoquinol methylase
VIKTFSAPIKEEKHVHITCALCGSRQYSKSIDVPGCSFVRCSSCGIVYQNPVPVFEDISRRYADQYFAYEFANEVNFFNLMKLGLRDIRFHEMDPSVFENRNFLDIGCATGMLLENMREKGFIVSGVDICSESAAYGLKKRNVPIFAGTLDEARFPDRHFSVVHFSHLIEHVPDPKVFMLEVRRILSDRGIAIITTPNIKGLQARLLGKKWRSAIPDHLYLFSKKTLARLLRETGFITEKIVTWGGIASGLAPSFIKKPMDVLAKMLGFGDVMLFLVRKTSAK